MNNQFAPTNFLIQRILITLLTILSIFLISTIALHNFQNSNPYVKEVLSLSGDIDKGHAIFQINCAGCHGWQADGNVGPSLKNVSKRKSKIALIKQVTSGKTPPMPKFKANSQEMADLLSYLEHI